MSDQLDKSFHARINFKEIAREKEREREGERERDGSYFYDSTR